MLKRKPIVPKNLTFLRNPRINRPIRLNLQKTNLLLLSFELGYLIPFTIIILSGEFLQRSLIRGTPCLEVFQVRIGIPGPEKGPEDIIQHLGMLHVSDGVIRSHVACLAVQRSPDGEDIGRVTCRVVVVVRRADVGDVHRGLGVTIGDLELVETGEGG